ncbi:hypothetical protein OH77DRAFT_1431629 [Trametes cingulata]|nr:hypothetical protein OH77DRAFT_1431629 [Trametes cingulata]
MACSLRTRTPSPDARVAQHSVPSFPRPCVSELGVCEWIAGLGLGLRACSSSVDGAADMCTCSRCAREARKEGRASGLAWTVVALLIPRTTLTRGPGDPRVRLGSGFARRVCMEGLGWAMECPPRTLAMRKRRICASSPSAPARKFVLGRAECSSTPVLACLCVLVFGRRRSPCGASFYRQCINDGSRVQMLRRLASGRDAPSFFCRRSPISAHVRSWDDR